MTARLDSKSTTVSLDIRVPLKLKKKIQKHAKNSGQTMSEYVRVIITNEIFMQENVRLPHK